MYLQVYVHMYSFYIDKVTFSWALLYTSKSELVTNATTLCMGYSSSHLSNFVVKLCSHHINSERSVYAQRDSP